MNILNLQGILLFFCAFLNLLLAFFLWKRSKRRKDIFWLSITALFSGLYAIFCGGVYFFWQPESIASVLWYRSTWLGVLMLPPFVLFTYYFVGKIKRIKLKALFLYLGAVLIGYFAFTTNLFLKSVHLKYPHISGIAGPLDVVGRFYILICLIIGLTLLLREYSKSKGYKKLQIKYFITGVIIYALAGIVFTVIMPLFTGESAYYGYTAYFSLIWMMLTTYAILKYRLMDIRFIIGRGIIYLFSFAVVIILGFLLIFLNQRLFRPVSFNFIGPLIIVISILLFQSIFRSFEKIASKYFYYTFYSYQPVLNDLSRRLTQFLDLDKLSSLIVNTLLNTMKLDRTVVLLRESGNGDYQIQKNIGFREENGISLVKDNFLTQYLEKTQKPLLYEELSLIIRDTISKKERRKLEKLRENMKRIEAVLCLPLFTEEKIVGMIVLGNKVSGDPYSKQDIELLTSLANQASIALQNAKLYSEVKSFNKKLEKEVEERTKELREAYEELKKLDKAKSEFVSIASHQLRTPLTAVKGYISMILEGTYGKMPEKVKKPLENIYLYNERLIKLVNDLLNISRIEAGRMEMKLKRSSIEEIISSVVEELKNEAKNKGIYLKWEKAKKPLPKILIDKDKIRQVIMNIIDNAIRYTEKGGVTINLKSQISSQSIRIIVKDTGMGLTKYELSKMFESFSRGTAGTRLYTEGVGLGLYVAKKFVWMHDGEIRAESKGKGKGSTFYIELPIK